MTFYLILSCFICSVTSYYTAENIIEQDSLSYWLLPPNFLLKTKFASHSFFFLIIFVNSFPTTPFYSVLILFLILILTSHVFLQLSLLVLILLSTQDLLHLIMPLLDLYSILSLSSFLIYHFRSTYRTAI